MEMIKIPKEKFEFCQSDAHLHDKKLETKPVGFFKDVFRRFCKNKGSVVAACIILVLVLFAIFAPLFCSNAYNTALTDTTYLKYQKLLPRLELFADMKLGFWDGAQNKTINHNQYLIYQAFAEETGTSPIVKVHRDKYQDFSSGSTGYYYDVRIDTYISNGMYYEIVSEEKFNDIRAWEERTGIQVIYPAVNPAEYARPAQGQDANIWYVCNEKSVPILKNGQFQDIYDRDEQGNLKYYTKGGDTGQDFKIRINSYTYFQYRYGFEPSFLFGTNNQGYDILTRLASAARFSLLLSVSVASVNLIIGAIIGAIMGYYGGAIDLILDRFIDILGGIPFMVVTALFQLHLMNKVGPVVSLLFAFFLTGWIGMASRVRMQFYRFKHQEYILAARTLGAKDTRLMFRHIFPNAIGTIITGSVLSIPGVIFSESSLTYLGIVNLESSTMTSVGTMLANGRINYTSYPHIVFFPALFIALLEISFNLFGNGLRDAFNPSLRGSED